MPGTRATAISPAQSSWRRIPRRGSKGAAPGAVPLEELGEGVDALEAQQVEQLLAGEVEVLAERVAHLASEALQVRHPRIDPLCAGRPVEDSVEAFAVVVVTQQQD